MLDLKVWGGYVNATTIYGGGVYKSERGQQFILVAAENRHGAFNALNDVLPGIIPYTFDERFTPTVTEEEIKVARQYPHRPVMVLHRDNDESRTYKLLKPHRCRVG